MSNIHGLHSNRRDSDDDDNNDNSNAGDGDEGNNRYVGGVDSRGGGSGLAVAPNPDHDPDGRSTRDSLFSLASAQANTDDATGGNGGGGGGGGGEPVRRTITMYRDGFTVDDGPYRRLDDPANAEFLTSLARGMTPRELSLDEDGNRRPDVTVGLIDKRGEDYSEPERGFESFSGAGSALGSAPTEVASVGESDGVIVPGGGAAASPPEVDGSRPSTSIQIRLLNGRRLVVKVNLDSPVSTLGQHVNASGDAGSEPFVLVSGFPPRPIVDLSKTVEECGLKGAQVMQKKA